MTDEELKLFYKGVEKLVYYGDPDVRHQPKPIGLVNYMNSRDKEVAHNDE